MRVSQAALLLGLAAAFAVSSGCARWTLFPKSAAPIPAPGETSRSGLLEATGLREVSSEENANSNGRDQHVVNDLTHLDPALAMARLAERQGSPSEARRQYQQFIKKNPRHPLPHHRLGVMAAREAKYDQAEAHFQMATRLAPPTAELLSDMGYLYYLQDRLGEAEHMLRQATQMEPSHHGANNNLGLVLAAKGNFDHSLRQFRRVNGEAEARANLAYMHSQRGNYNKSRDEYLRALTLDNSLTNAAEALLQVEEARKREVAALAKVTEAAGDDLLASQASMPIHQPVAHAGWNGQPVRQPSPGQQHVRATHPHEQPTEMSQLPIAESHVGSQPPVASRPRTEPVAAKPVPETDRFAQQSQVLMPIPAPPATSEAADYPSQTQSYPDTSVQPASYVEGSSRFTAPLNGESSEAMNSEEPPIESQPEPVRVQTNWQDAWQQLSGQSSSRDMDAREQLNDQPQTTPEATSQELQPSKSGGVRITIGG